MEKVIWIVNKKCLSSFFLFNQRRHVFTQIRQRRRQRRRPTSILYLSLSLSANDHFMSRRLGLEEDQLESKKMNLSHQIVPFLDKSTNNCLEIKRACLGKASTTSVTSAGSSTLAPTYTMSCGCKRKFQKFRGCKRKYLSLPKVHGRGDMYLWWVENIQLLLGYHTLVHHIASGLLHRY